MMDEMLLQGWHNWELGVLVAGQSFGSAKGKGGRERICWEHNTAPNLLEEAPQEGS